MKIWKIKLTALTPFLIGSHRVTDNHYETLDYIPSNVLQAAFAKAILSTNELYDVNEAERRYYIDEKAFQLYKEGSRPEWIVWLANFPSLSFSDANPMGAHPYTPTTFTCKKKGDQHPLVETLAKRYELKFYNDKKIENFKCSVCGSRYERKDGWNLPKDRKIYKRLINRIEINNHRLVGEDERLYSLAVGEPFSYIRLDPLETKPLYFEAYCYSPVDDDLSITSDQEIEIYVGAYSTTGMGKMQVEVTEVEDQEQENRENIRLWQNGQSQFSKDERPFTNTVAIQVLSNIPYDFDQQSDYITTEEQLTIYTNWLQQFSNLPKEASVDFTFIQSLSTRSFVPGLNIREKSIQRFIKSGSVFIFKFPNNELAIEWAMNVAQNGLPLNRDGKMNHYPIRIVDGQYE